MSEKLLAENRKARFNYHILETFEAGIILTGTEVKSCRAGKVNLTDAYGAFRMGELFLQNAHIQEYSHGNRSNHAPTRVRKLLLHKAELMKLVGRLQSGETFVPLKIYIKNRHIKVLMGLAKGKKTHDKREDLKKKQAKREIERSFRR
jgi:SsrA-binding protein